MHILLDPHFILVLAVLVFFADQAISAGIVRNTLRAVIYGIAVVVILLGH